VRHKAAQNNPRRTNSQTYELRTLFQILGLSQYAVLAGLETGVFSRHSGGCKSKSEQLPHCGRPAWHPVGKSEIVNRFKLMRRKHDLQALQSFSVVSLPPGAHGNLALWRNLNLLHLLI
jgi:hypothetical protein